MTERAERRKQSMAARLVDWITRAGIGLIVYFLMQINTDVRALAQVQADMRVDIGILKERTSPHTSARTP